MHVKIDYLVMFLFFDSHSAKKKKEEERIHAIFFN